MATMESSAGSGPDIRQWAGRPVTGSDGTHLGRLEHVYLGKASDAPTWGVVDSGERRAFVPLAEAAEQDGGLAVPVRTDQVRGAPELPENADLDPDTESRLEHHYAADGHGSAAAGLTAGAYAASEVGAAETADTRTHRSDEREPGRGHAPHHRTHGGALAYRRSRGVVSGTLLIVLGAWGALIPLLGPLFMLGMGTEQAWAFSFDRLWLSLLPGIAVLLGGLLLAPSANRLAGMLGGWLGMLGGAWFVIGPVLSILWGSGGPGATYGGPVATEPGMVVATELVYFYGLGAVIIALSAFALGRLAVRSVRD